MPAGSSAGLRVARDRLALALGAAREEPDFGQQLSEFPLLSPPRSSASRPRAPAERSATCAVPATAVAYWRRDDMAPDRGAARSQGVQVRRLALFVVHRRWVVIILAALFLPFAAIVGGGVAEKLTVGGLEDPASESARTAEAAPGAVRQGRPVGLRGPRHRPRRRRRRRGRRGGGPGAHRSSWRQEAGIVQASSYWSTGSLAAAQERGRRAGAGLRVGRGRPRQRRSRSPRSCRRSTRATPTSMTTAVTGRAEIARQVSEQAEKDLQRSELLTAPIIFIALVARVRRRRSPRCSRSASAILAVVGTLLVLTILVALTEVSVFALNLTTGLGLGLAIDYSLFVVSRYREELADGASTNVAIGRTMQTAGRTVAFSAGDRDDLARRAAALPGDVPAVVRVRRRRGGVPRRGRVGDRPAGDPRRPRPTGRGAPHLQGRRTVGGGLLGPPGRAGS